jgi:Methyltransferase domain
MFFWGEKVRSEEKSKADIRRFIFRKLARIDGYLEPQDAFVFTALVRGQELAKIAGGIAEVGVYFGRSYFLLRRVASPDTKIAAIDLFDSHAIGSQVDQYSQFLENGRSLSLPVDERLVIAADSTTLLPGAILEKAGKIRFFSIDGGHAIGNVKSDSALAKECLCDSGVIAFDDVHNPRWPEVTIGLSDFIRENDGKYSVIAFTRFKAYVCESDQLSFYRHVLLDSPILRPLERDEIEYMGSKALFLHVSVKRRILYEIFQRLRLFGVAGRFFNPL